MPATKHKTSSPAQVLSCGRCPACNALNSAVRRHYDDMAGSWATDRKLADHFAGYGRREGRVAQRLRVVLTYDAAALVEDDAGTAHGRVSDQLYSLIGTMAVALQLGAEMVRVGALDTVRPCCRGTTCRLRPCVNAHNVRAIPQPPALRASRTPLRPSPLQPPSLQPACRRKDLHEPCEHPTLRSATVVPPDR